MPVEIIDNDVDTHEVHPQPKVLIVVPPNKDEYFLLMSIISVLQGKYIYYIFQKSR